MPKRRQKVPQLCNRSTFLAQMARNISTTVELLRELIAVRNKCDGYEVRIKDRGSWIKGNNAGFLDQKVIEIGFFIILEGSL